MDYPFRTNIPELNVTYPFDSVDWTPELGYPETVQVDDMPWRPWGPGSHLGLTVVLDANLNEYFCSSEVSIGFKVIHLELITHYHRQIKFNLIKKACEK